MTTDIFTFCDSAKEYNGKLVIVGAFNTIKTPTFPVIGLQSDLALRVVFSDSDRGVHKMSLLGKRVEDGEIIFKTLEVEIDITDGIKEQKTLNIILSCPQMEFKRPGEYVFYIDIDGERSSSSLFLKEIKETI